jgi:hypothetical protein
MKRATITIPDDLEAELSSYLRDQDPAPSLTRIVQTALRHFLAETRLERELNRREVRPASKPLQITPAEHGSGVDDVSIEHDRYLTAEI